MNFWNVWDKAGIYLILIIVFMVFTILTPSMLEPSNIINILTQAAVIAIAGAGMTLAITSGGFDLSIGAILTLTTCVVAKTVPIYGFWMGLLIAILVGILIGSINGLIITKLKIITFVATLATMIIIRGIAFIYTGGKDIILVGRQDIKMFSSGTLLYIPVPIILMIAVFFIIYILYKYTSFGVFVRSIGSNQNASIISGINVDRTLIYVFIATAVTSVISGFILISQLSVGNGRYGTTFALEVITATILGGTSLKGGRGNVWGTMVAAIMLSSVKTGLNLLGAVDAYQKLATGVILILAISIVGIREMTKKESA